MTEIPNISVGDDLSHEARLLIERLMCEVSSLTSQNEALAKQNADLAHDMAEAGATIKELIQKSKQDDATIERLLEQIKLMNARFFGAKSERVSPGQLSLFNDMEAAADKSVTEPLIEDVLPKKKDHRRGGKRVIDFSKFETVIINHELAEDARVCGVCEGELVKMNEEVTKKIRIVPAHLIVEEHHRFVYKCEKCCCDNAAGKEVAAQIVRADMPHDPIPGSFATPSLLSWIANGKYVRALPLYRMEDEFYSMGASISRQNMANWMMDIHERWLSLIHVRMKEKLLSCKVIHADETVIQVLKEPDRKASAKSRMWLFCSGRSDVPIYIYEYHETRGKSVAENFLRNWSGYLTTDGYQPYFTLETEGEIVNVACLVHIRRPFAQIVKAAGGDAKAEAVQSIALRARRLIDEMFAIDAAFDEMEPEERRIARAEKLAPKMDAFGIWIDEQIPKASPGLKLYEALLYAKKYFSYTKNVLIDGRLELDNNIAERAIKPFVIGRKNWLFSDTPRGADASAAIYSVVTTAKMNGLNPQRYIEWLLEEMPNAGHLTDSALDGFVPWSDTIPERLYMSKEAFEKARRMDDEPIADIDPTIFDKD